MRSFWKPLNDVADMIELLIECHPQGFGVLLGDVPPPSSSEVHAMLDARRPHEKLAPPATPDHTTEAERIVWDAEAFEAAVRTARGWPHITRVCREYREADARFWSVVMDHARFVGTATTRFGSRLGYVAATYGLSPNTVMKYRREFPVALARAILAPDPDDDDFRLMPG